VLGEQFNRPAANALARTGSNTSPLFALGLLLEVAGAMLVVIARRRRAMKTGKAHAE
jgi:LPXTG-motif cell wall-anchored protein